MQSLLTAPPIVKKSPTHPMQTGDFRSSLVSKSFTYLLYQSLDIVGSLLPYHSYMGNDSARSKKTASERVGGAKECNKWSTLKASKG